MKCKTFHVRRTQRHAFEAMSSLWFCLRFIERKDHGARFFFVVCSLRVPHTYGTCAHFAARRLLIYDQNIPFGIPPISGAYDTYTQCKCVHHFFRCFTWIKHMRFFFSFLSRVSEICFVVFWNSSLLLPLPPFLPLIYWLHESVWFCCIWLQFIWFAHFTHAIIFPHKFTYSGWHVFA